MNSNAESKTLPEGWREVSLEEACKVITSPVDKKTVAGELPVKLCNYTDVYYNNFIDSKIRFMTASAKPQEIGKFSIFENDVIITKDSETPDDIGVPAYVKETISNLLCGYHLTILRPKKQTLGKYVRYALTSPRVKHNFYRFANGITRFGLTAESYQKIKIPLPPLSEQKAIASLLETWDTAIEKTEALIAAKEKRFRWLLKTLISDQQTIIKKDEIHLGDLFDIQVYSSKSLSITANGNRVVVDMGAISRQGSLIETKKTNLDYDLLFKHDLVMPKDDIGGGNIIGKVAIIEEDNKYICGDHVYRLISKTTNNPYFLYFMINSFTINKQLRTKANGTAQLGLGKKDVLKQKVSIPKLEKQNEIASLLNTTKQNINFLQRITEKYHTQKHGLMQKLLDGKWRLKV